MNYHFVVKVFDIKINNLLSRGKKIDENARISNGAQNYKRLFVNEAFVNAIGILEARALEDCTYFYEIGEFNQLKIVFEGEYPPTIYLNYLMRKMQLFLNSLWLVKDNSVNLETGYLHLYPNKRPFQGTIHSNAIGSSPTNCFGEFNETVFTTEELELAIKYYNILLKEETDLKDTGGERLPSRNPLTKENGRIGRAFYFMMLARYESVLPIKIMNYCSVLECLFTSDSSEVTHKVSERFARFMGNNFEERKIFFKLVKDLYKIRSKAVHGQPVNSTPEDMRKLLKEIDNSIREIFVGYFMKEEKYKVFDEKQEQYEKWFNELILN
ncbi:hypothetical protein [Neobacillus sp. NPDC093127]|uniref:hypothetical protein n=1 Tax=Neobacillus sp. NPDC093127 TaxID=3364296 RepID=UPI0037F815AB